MWTVDSTKCSNYSNFEPYISKQLIYNRVPKCGSKGFRHLISHLSSINNYGVMYVQYPDMPRHLNKTHLKEIVEHVSNRSSNPWVYIRHVHFIDFSWFNKSTPYYINIVRDPVARIVSAFYFRRQWRPDSMSEERRNMTFDQCVKEKDYECQDPKYTFVIIPYFCGQDSYCVKPSRRALEQAKRNVVKYFSVVGYLEEYNKFISVVEKIWPRFFKNASDVYAKLSDNSDHHKTTNKINPKPKTVKTVKNRLGLDYEFYEFIKHRFHCLYTKMFKT